MVDKGADQSVKERDKARKDFNKTKDPLQYKYEVGKWLRRRVRVLILLYCTSIIHVTRIFETALQ
jgi:hypothetical protein